MCSLVLAMQDASLKHRESRACKNARKGEEQEHTLHGNQSDRLLLLAYQPEE